MYGKCTISGNKIRRNGHKVYNAESSHLFAFQPEIIVFDGSICIFFLYSSLHLHHSSLSPPIMKKLLFIFSILFLSSGAAIHAQSTLTVKWSFVGIVEGYDHDNKCIVWLNGDNVGESDVTKESEPNSITINVARGKFNLEVINYALYEGEWEKHLIENDYSIDCNYVSKKKVKLGKEPVTLTLTFDINSGTMATFE